ncbi:mitochondrial ribosomal death-associated protein 3-domain-containing protein [Alternaria rosae]|uniref:mitochondrial ribosomal death-associated protein 3-domain-containing protein n=1 Tax=Alternaria rosae TaxID=1187941 RepID=UPI001E8DD7A9|nr:mitochondrial ribosomal death-associated protein 3-domain-containing protein [Alternaria rosae]KAH6839674.1 mitochondrial ribosomal death-associated protein 3-domain-containing protein [Alternaria rosae]
MPPSTCFRSFSQLSLDAAAHGCIAPRVLRPQIACFSTSSARYAVKGVKSLNTKKGRGASGGGKAQRKRIVLSNDNALEVSSLRDLTKDNVLSEQNEGKVMGLPQETVVDALASRRGIQNNPGMGSKKTIRRILCGQRMSGKSTLVLQGLTMGFLRGLVCDQPTRRPLVNAHTDYAPLPNSEPMQYWRRWYGQSRKHHGPVFVALWNELSLPGRPQSCLHSTALSHVMRHSEYMSAERNYPTAAWVLGATSRSNAPTSPAMDHCIEAAVARQKSSEKLPEWNPYKSVDVRELDIINVGGLTKEEARSIMEYYAESGMLRHQVNEGFVAEKWSLAGMGNIGELEKASVRMRL